ncbi:cupredoxin domain-containing protein [Paraconexibacter antarcticus]|uniref:Cupredoxin domain-containing protein n=1 Tax=Paraconexibacter antarcticus TaxID=2949664 RepID=A0ABY5DWP6_9ACTN|nr:cupredoxin domain-containing protein [Paraconexibacter antarcticus]UTI65698.1 cupredoxin domain-containing protein [Paraconexibacter antarcticus]
MTATFTFRDGALGPARLVVRPRGSALRLVLVAADGHPHGVVTDVGGRRVRLVVAPGATRQATVAAPRPGRYRVVPDGAAPPVLLVVR